MASTRRRFAVEATGVNRVRKQLRDLGLGDALDEQLRPVHREVAGVVASDASKRAPRRTGRLAGTIEAVDDPKDRWPLVRAGAKGDVPYGGPIHFGWPTRGLHRNERALLDAKGALLAGQGGAGFGLRAVTKIERRRKAVAKGRNKQIRGGPIKPQPFLYEAADARRGAVLAVYQDGVNRIFAAAIEGGSDGG